MNIIKTIAEKIPSNCVATHYAESRLNSSTCTTLSETQLKELLLINEDEKKWTWF